MICYVSPCDPSGYGEANRMDITALWIAGVNMTVEPLKQMSENTDYGLPGDIVKRLKNRHISYKIKILHTTPDIYPQYMEDGKYHIGRLFWETNRLPKDWIEPCNKLQEIWTSTPQQQEMIKNSGVTTPVYCFPQAIDVTKAYEKIAPLQLEQKRDFIFYSIFQFINRKNPKALFHAYWKEFEGNDTVTLLVKTYGVTYVDSEYQRIKQEILTWKKELALSHYPKVFLVHSLLTDRQMNQFHKLGDVYVNPSASEGFCRPVQEAMLLGNPVISPKCGITDILPEEYFYPVSSHLVQAREQSFILYYSSGMKWKEVDEGSLRKQMRNVYENQGMEAIATGKLAQEYIINNFSYQKVGQQMRERLEKIDSLI